MDPLLAGDVAARSRLLAGISERADLCADLARGVRAGTVDPGSGVAEGLDAMAEGLRLYLASQRIALHRQEPAPSTLWGRVRWLLTGG